MWSFVSGEGTGYAGVPPAPLLNFSWSAVQLILLHFMDLIAQLSDFGKKERELHSYSFGPLGLAVAMRQ